MIIGVITAGREAVIRVPVRNQGGQAQAVQGVIDTGFNGYLTLPASLVGALGLAYHSQIVVTLADGSSRMLRMYEALIVWDGRERDALVRAAAGEPLVGMALLYGHTVVLNGVTGGRVTIQAVVP